jgi:hypothetical protein
MVMFGSLALSQAQNYEAELDPFQEVPPHNTPGYGSAGFSLSGTTLNVTSGSYNDLLGNSTAVTVNDAPAGVNGPVVFSLTLTSPGTTAGTFTGSGTLTPAQITDLGAGNLYVNVSDNVYPSGEIRGQILAAPDEPATMALLGTSSLALLALRRRQV